MKHAHSHTLLPIAARDLATLLVGLSLVLLYRGHNLPGGGFIGGLVAASAVILIALAHNWEVASRRLPIDPLTLMATGLLIAFASGLPALLAGQAFMTGQWLPTWYLPILGKLKLGTPLLFDIGVYLAVIGFTVKCARALGTSDDSWKS